MNDDAPALQPSPSSESPAPSPAPVPEAAPFSARCSHCDAELKNLRVDPGQPVRCLNCGKRFVPLPAAAQASGSGEALAADAPAATPMLPRDVKTPGYWLLRAPAILVCFGATLLFGILAVSFIEQSFRWNPRFEGWAFATYALLLPLGGFVLLGLTQSLARIDAGMATWLEREKPGSSVLPPVSGASLPYILPMAVGGGLLPVVAFSTIDHMEQAVVIALIGAAIFYAAFALEDLRQFVWRQAQFQERFAGGNAPLSARSTPSTLACVLAFGIAALFTILQYERPREIMVFYAILVCMGGAAFTLGSIDSALSRIADAWQNRHRPVTPEPFFLATPSFWVGLLVGAALFGLCALISLDPERRRGWGTQEVLDPLTRLTRTAYAMALLGPAFGFLVFLHRHRIRAHTQDVPLWIARAARFTTQWVALGVVFLCYLWVWERPFFWNFYRELTIAGFIFPGLAYLALFLGDLLLRLTRWRLSVENRVGPHQDLRELSPLQVRFISVAVAIALIQASLLGIVFIKEWRGSRPEFLFVIVLALGLFHYPTLWFALVLRELWRIQAALAAAVKSPE